MRRQHWWTSSTAILGLLALLLAPLLVATTAVGAAEAPDHGPSGQAIGASSAEAADGLVPVGSLALPGFNADVWEHEGFAYVGTWGSPSNYPARCPATGVRIIDIHDPSAPRIVAEYDSVELATGLDVSGDLMAVCNRTLGLELVDIRDALHPRHLGALRLGEAQGVRIVGERAYVGVWHNRKLAVVDIADPCRPRVMGEAALGGFGWGLAVNGSLAYCATGHDAPGESGQNRGHGFDVVDVSDPAAPRSVARINTPPFYRLGNDWWWMAASGAHAFLADGENGVFAFDVRDPLHPVAVAHAATADYAGVVALQEGRLLVADMDSTIIGQECIDELADLVGLKAHVSAITERAMRGEIAKIATPGGGTLQERFISQPDDQLRDYTLKWDGESQITYETFRDMGTAYAVGLILIYLLVVAQFGSYLTPLIIMAPIPLTIIGVMPGHALLGAQYTATSMIGMIALAGIIVRNSILLVDFINLQVRSGMDFKQAIVNAAITRAQPIVLTGLAAMLGAFFILDDPIFNGLAISLIFGIAVSTVLTLVVIPTLYYAAYRKRLGALARDEKLSTS